MKINELMIDDWIRSSGTKEKRKVSSINSFRLDIELIEPIKGNFFWHPFIPSAFEGIPLTKEIILLNADRFSLKHKDAPIPFWRDEDKFYCGCNGGYEFEVKYVHEVQNFLRVIGFSDEADDFIIE